MLRKALIAGLNEVQDAIATSHVLESIRMRPDKQRQDIGIGLKALFDYSLAANTFSSAGREVVSIFELSQLEDPKLWVPILSDDSPHKQKLVRSMLVMQSELPKLVALLQQDSVTQQPDQRAGDSAQIAALDVVRVSLVEEKGQFSTVQRVIEGLTACQELYESLQKLNGDVATPLAIGAIDSGSDKSFDLFGAAELMKQFRELVISIWGLIVFHREHKLGKRLELIASALPILERVNSLEQANKLGREEAQIIRNGIIDGAKKFIRSGVLTEDLAAHTTHDPRELMTPEPKLLTGPLIQSSGQSASTETDPHPVRPGHSGAVDSFSRLSAEDLEQLANMLAARDIPPKRDELDNTKQNDNGG
ncbi:MAG: hypothetical protein WCV99_16825 [Sterolibacterium sp.]|jgi:hypothetical protein